MPKRNEILHFVEENEGVKVREIADQVGLDKSEVNSILYDAKEEETVTHDDDYRWYPAGKEDGESENRLERSLSSGSFAEKDVDESLSQGDAPDRSSIAEQLDKARKDELLDLTLRNPLISHRTLKSRGVEVIDERPVEVYRILVEEDRKMSFLEVSEEKKEELGGEDDYEMIFGQPDEEEDEDQATTGTAERHVDTKLQTPYTSKQLQKRLRGSYYHGQRSIEEEGINTLFLALGMLRWYRSSSAEKERKAPFFSCRLS